MKFVIVPELHHRYSWELRVVDGSAVAASGMSFGSAQAAIADVIRFRNEIVGVRLGDEETEAQVLGSVLASALPTARSAGRRAPGAS